MEQTVTPTPAAIAPQTTDTTPTTQSATHAAVASGDIAGFRAARRAERIGKPLPEVSVPTPEVKTDATTGAVDVDPAAPAQPTTEPPKPSRKEREQAETNERIRRAVEAATADLRTELDRVKGAKPGDPSAPAQPEPKKQRFQTLAEWSVANPEGTLEDFMDARDEWRDSQRQNVEQERTVGEALEADTTRVIESFDARVAEAEKADPKIRAKISPLANALGAKGGPFGVVARVAAVADKGPQVLGYLADHPDVLKSLVTLPERLRGLPLQLQIEQHKQHIAREIGRLEGKFDTSSVPAIEPAQPKTLTDAPAVAHTLGTKPSTAADPKASAIRSGNTRAYRELRRAERVAARR